MNNSKEKIGLGKYLPNYITFLSLGFGLVSIVLSTQDYIFLAGMFIIGSSIFDSLDGFSARKFNLESTFGLQLDSLTDMVCFGVAPIVLVSQHLHLQDRFSLWLIPFFLLQIWAGAFRLARFNLQPPKESSTGSSLGLTISLSGLILTLMILSDLTQTGDDYPMVIIMGQILLLCFLMVSRIRFPALSWFVPHWSLYIVYGIAVVIVVIQFSIFTAIWNCWLCILGASIIQHLILARQEKVML
ncbi:MAG: hypothetical protein DRI65_09735 [Chloroflexota bacterium]|nr:MAG: hypothetical protein DRI65_09735 [Chloroflexota bacterium]